MILDTRVLVAALVEHHFIDIHKGVDVRTMRSEIAILIVFDDCFGNGEFKI